MDKSARLSAIMSAVNENTEKSEQAKYGAKMGLETREYSHVIKCCEKLIAIDAQNIILRNEANTLQLEITNEREKEALEAIV